MPRTCTICTHDQRVRIELALCNATSLRGIARRFQVSKDALARHRRETNNTKATDAPPIAPVMRNATGQIAQSAQVKKSADRHRTLNAATQFVAVHDATGAQRIVTGKYWNLFGTREVQNGWRLT